MTVARPLEPVVFDFSQFPLTAPGAGLRELIRSLNNQSYVGAQKRKSKRVRIAIEVPAVGLDEQFQPVGEPFVAMSRDISTTALCLVHTCSVRTPFLLVRLAGANGEPLQLVTKIVRSRQLKRFFEMAGEFVLRCAESSNRAAEHGS